MTAAAGAPAVLGDIVARNAVRYGDKPALVGADGTAVSFAAFADRVHRLAAAFRDLGLQRGGRVAILSRNRPDYLATICAAAAGGIAVPLNWRLTPGELAVILNDCTPDTVVADSAGALILDELAPDLDFVRHRVAFDRPAAGWVSHEALIRTPADPVSLAATPEATACLVYTSGTTGRPKGAELTHRGLLANCATAISAMLGLREEDVTLAPMPFFHVGGLWYHLFPSFAAGCTTHVMAEFDAAAALALIARERITNLHVVPTMLHALLARPEIGTTDLSSLRLVFYAASTMPISLLRRAMAAFSHCEFVQGYGSTEAGMVTCLTAADHRLAASSPAHEQLLLSCGRVLPTVSATLLEEDGQVGEIAVQSPATMARYWANPAATATARAGDWLRTGDIGQRDAAGYFTILDRKSDMIVTGGENVYPREVEDVLLLDDDLAEVAVFDLPDEHWVQKVVAAIVPKSGRRPSPEAVIAQARSRLASYKCPKQVFVVESLPKNGAGKVLRKVLRATFAAASI